MGDFILVTKLCCEEIYTPLRNADVSKVLHSIGDPYGLAIWEQTEEIETMLEVSMLEEELPEPEEMVRWASSIEPLSDDSKNILIKMMEQLSEAHYQAAQVAQSLADLAKTCSLSQIMTIMKFAVRPLIQLEGMLGHMGMELTPRRRKKDLPDEIEGQGEPHIVTKPRSRFT